MQNTSIQKTVNDGVLYAPYNQDTLQGFIDLKDLAEIACEVILNPINHNWATYELVGENTSLNNVAQIISRVASLPVLRCELVPRETFLNEGLAHAGADTREGLGRMLYYYDQR